MSTVGSTRLPVRRGRQLVSGRRLVQWLLLFVTLYLLVVPFAVLIFSSFRDTTTKLPFEHTGFTLANYTQAFWSTQTLHIVGTTLLYALGSVAVSIAIVVPLAFLLERTDFPFRGLLTTVVVAPLGLPPFVAAMAWILLANPTTGVVNSILNSWLGRTGNGPLNIYTMGGMIFISALLFVPSMYLMVSGTFSRIDPALEESSLTSGADFARTIRRVTVPLLVPALLGAVVFYFVIAIELFDVPAFIGIPGKINVLSTWVFRLVRNPGGLPNYGIASAFGVLTVLLAAAIITAYRWTVRDAGRFVTVGGRGFRPHRLVLPRWLTWVSAVVLVLYGVLAFALPFAVLIWRSFVPQFSAFDFSSIHQLTLANYRGVFDDPNMRGAVEHTLVIATVTAVVTMTLASLVAWLGLREATRASSFSTLLVFVNLGIPSVVLALAVSLLYLWMSIGIYGTVWIIVIAMVTRFLPYGSMVMTPALMQVGRDLEDASAASGASYWRTFRSVVAPLIMLSYVRGALWTWVQATRDISIVLLLVTVSNVTVGAQLYGLWFDGNFAQGAAASVLLATVTSLITFVFVRLDPGLKRVLH